MTMLTERPASRNGRALPFARTPAGGGGRVTRPAYYSPYSGNGLGIVPRRGLDPISARFLAELECLRDMAGVYPLRLLALVTHLHPLVRQAWSNNQSLGFAPGDTRIVAVKDLDGQAGGREAQDDAGTAALDDLWDRHGGLVALQRAGSDQAMTAGMACYEGVPGPRGMGLADVLTFDPLSVRFRQGKDSGEPPLVAQQSQTGGFVDLPGESCFCVGMDATRDNPYGIPLFSAVLTEALEDVGLQRILRDVLYAVAWPRTTVGFPLEELVKFGEENYASLGLLQPGQQYVADGAPTAAQWAMEQFEALRTLMESLKAAETLIFPKGGTVGTLNGGDLRGTEGTLQMQRHRLVMAVDQPPTLLGIDTGGTKAYGSVHWKVYALKLEALRHFVNSILVKLANLHLRLLGLPLTARAEVTPIRTEDLLQAAEARSLETETEFTHVRAGFTSAEEASITLTGSGLYDQERADKYFTAPPPNPQPAPDKGQGASQDAGADGGQDNTPKEGA